MAAITVANLIVRLRRILQDEPQEDKTTATINSTTTTSLTVNQPTRWKEGDIAELQDDGEQLKIVTGGSNPLTTKRAHNDTTASLHNSNGIVLLQIVPGANWSYDEMSEALTRVVDEWWPRVWKKITTTVIPLTTSEWYDLATTVLEEVAINVSQKTTATIPSLAVYTPGGSTGYSYEIKRNIPTGLVTSGVGIRFPSGFDNTTNTIQVDYRGKVTTSDIDDGLMSECLLHGAAYKLLINRYAHNTGSPNQGIQSAVSAAGVFKQRYEELLMLLEMDLEHQIPRQRRWVSATC